MFDIYYDKLSSKEKEEFAFVCNKLLLKNYILRDIYVEKDKAMKSNYDYRFIERHKQLIENYLSYSGWHLTIDSKYGVAYVINTYELNKATFNKMTTIFLLVLRLIYDEEREKLSLKTDVLISVRDLVDRLLSIGTIKKKPSDKDIEDALKLIFKFNIISKQMGSWSNPETKLIIYPSILFVMTDGKVNELADLIETEDEGEEETEEDV
jgi:hypothetical protein